MIAILSIDQDKFTRTRSTDQKKKKKKSERVVPKGIQIQPPKADRCFATTLSFPFLFSGDEFSLALLLDHNIAEDFLPNGLVLSTLA